MRVFLSLFFVLLIGCASILGIRTNPSVIDPETIKQQFAAFKIPSQNQFILNDTSYTATIKRDAFSYISTLTDSLEILKTKSIAKDNLQPLQVRYFDKKGSQIFKLVNCYVPPSSKWNVDGCFNTFPPNLSHQQTNQLHHKLDFFLDHIIDINGNKLNFNSLPPSEYYALVFWNDIFYKMSDSMIQTISQYNQLHSKKGIFTLFVNNHNSTVRLINEDK